MASFVFSRKLSGFRPVMLFAQPVYQRSEQIRAILLERLGARHATLFGEPTITADALSGNATALWSNPLMSNRARALSDLTGTEKDQAVERLRNLLDDMDQLSTTLKADPDPVKRQLGDLLDKASELPGDEFIFVEGEDLTFVLWGFYAEVENARAFIVRRFVNEHQVVVPKKTVVPPISKPVEQAVRQKRDYKWLWILLGLLLLLLLAWWLWRRQPLLPERQGVFVPVDSTKLIDKPGDPLKRKIVGNRLNIYLDKSANLTDFAKKLVAENSEEPIQVVFYESAYNLLQVEFDLGSIEIWRSRLKKYPEVKLVFDEAIFAGNYIPSDPGFSVMENNYHFNLIEAFKAWDITRGDSSVVVAVIDNGFDLRHPELLNKSILPWNVITHSAAVNSGTGGKLDHGTHVAALAVGRDENGRGTSGVAPNCRLMPIQVSDDSNNMSTLALINAVFYAVNNGADVVNLSLGVHFPTSISEGVPIPEQEATADSVGKEEEEVWNIVFEYAASHQCVVVQAAGNDNVSTVLDPMKRSKYAINVAACDPGKTRAGFSNFGSKATVTAPGVRIFSALPNNSFDRRDGTSMAAPIVAGAVALIKSSRPQLTFEQIKKLLVDTGIPVSSEPDKPVGPLIQLAKALGVPVEADPCQAQIDSLKREIEKLKLTGEKLRIPDNPKDCNFANGNWQSSTDLVNVRSKEKVEIFFEFKQGCTGTITYLESGKLRCSSQVLLSLDQSTLMIDQLGSAACNSPGFGYEAYTFTCKTDGLGDARCEGTRKSSSKKEVEFVLVKR
ncbi:S8 family serine peptidase [Dyadobacter diqingensis]|uniref:S8 family serine peptidase n=1 Tax=Dyadobacter diqingensis TaxID=2938121 RepID=UPI0020C1B82F|nr:S8 family serine peptidase [Dyadobacter diqingensis]